MVAPAAGLSIEPISETIVVTERLLHRLHASVASAARQIAMSRELIAQARATIARVSAQSAPFVSSR